MSKWSVVGWSVVGGSVVGGFNKTLSAILFTLYVSNNFHSNRSSSLYLRYFDSGTKYL